MACIPCIPTVIEHAWNVGYICHWEAAFLQDAPLVEFMDLVFTYMQGESYRRRLRSLLLYLCYVFRALINPLVCWFCTSAMGLVLLQIHRHMVLPTQFPIQIHRHMVLPTQFPIQIHRHMVLPTQFPIQIKLWDPGGGERSKCCKKLWTNDIRRVIMLRQLNLFRALFHSLIGMRARHVDRTRAKRRQETGAEN